MKHVASDGTVRIYVNTVDSSGAPVAPSSAFAAADFAIHKDGSATEKSTTNGITVTSPFDSETGLHLIEIDTSNDTGDAGFWADWSTYQVRFNTAKTVDSVSIDGRKVPDGEFLIDPNIGRTAAIAGDLNVTVAPLSSSITARVNGTTISYFVGEIIAQTVAITDSAGSAVDLSAKTLQVVIDSPQGSHSDVQVIASGSITVSGASNNQITFTNSAAVTATARTLRWALRDTANGDEVLAHGRVVVTEAAEED